MLQCHADPGLVLLQGDGLRAEFHVHAILREVVAENTLREILTQDQRLLMTHPPVSKKYCYSGGNRYSPLGDPGSREYRPGSSIWQRAPYLQAACTFALEVKGLPGVWRPRRPRGSGRTRVSWARGRRRLQCHDIDRVPGTYMQPAASRRPMKLRGLVDDTYRYAVLGQRQRRC